MLRAGPVYLGLAVLGGVAAFFSQPALIAFPITLLVACGIAVISGGDLSLAGAEVVQATVSIVSAW